MKKKKIIFGFIIFLVGIQFIKTDKTSPQIYDKQKFTSQFTPPIDLLESLRSSCYDCHSYETKYPWYTFVAPVSFWIAGHVRNGRKKLNFSTIGQLNKKDQRHLMHECAEVIEEGRMPPKGYVRMHSDAHLDENQQRALIEWFNKNS